MDEKIIVSCCKCGKKGTVYKDIQNNNETYYILCECGNRSNNWGHIENALNEWKEINKPKKVKPKYHCGYCGAELTFGFDICAKCGTEIDW